MTETKSKLTAIRIISASIVALIRGDSLRLLRDRAGFGWMNSVFVMAAIGVLVFAEGQPLVDQMTEQLRVVSNYGIGLLSR